VISSALPVCYAPASRGAVNPALCFADVSGVSGVAGISGGGELAPVTVAAPQAATQGRMKSAVQFLPVITGKN
jgi:hypothetical protein